uniref:Tetraspanin n=1 Tax=Branchiostoma belcheri tsingtauense TaxID=155462 RepID=Q2TCS8_BRABE|nr:tetraspanin family protein [Branchiostoma belcheri tsingtauense]
MEGCGLQCIKYLLFAFNLLFWLAGAGMVGVGIYVMVAYGVSNVFQLLNLSELLLRGGGIALIVVGVITMIVGFLGCCGAIKENRCMLGAFFTLLLILLLVEIGVAIYAFVQRGQFFSLIGTAVDTTSTVPYTSLDQAARTLVDFTQTYLKCCGMNDTNNYNPTPASCSCAASVSTTSICTGGNYNQPCKTAIISFLAEKSLIVGGIGIGIGLTQLIGMIFACCLFQAKGKESDVV